MDNSWFGRRLIAWMLLPCFLIGCTEGTRLVRTDPTTITDERTVVYVETDEEALLIGVDDVVETRHGQRSHYRKVTEVAPAPDNALSAIPGTAIAYGLGGVLIVWGVAENDRLADPSGANPAILGGIASTCLAIAVTALFSPKYKVESYFKDKLGDATLELEPIPDLDVQVSFPSGLRLEGTTSEAGVARFPIDDVLAQSGSENLDALIQGTATLEFDDWSMDARPLVVPDSHLDPLRIAYSRWVSEPPRLTLGIEFDDTESLAPNNALDAFETASVVVSVQNSGGGPALGVALGHCGTAPTDQGESGIQLSLPVAVGDIDAGASRSVSVPITGAGDLPDEDVVAVRLCAHEQRDFDSVPTEIQFATRSLSRPELDVVAISLRDGRRGEASGDGDGVLENGERAEIVVDIANSGAGPALGVSVDAACSQSSVVLPRSHGVLDRIPPGAVGSVTFLIEVPPRFEGEKVVLGITATDGRGAPVGSGRLSEALPFVRRMASLELDGVQVVDDDSARTRGDGDGVLENGERVELRVDVRNVGDLGVEGISASVQESRTGGQSFGDLFFGDIGPGGASQASMLLEIPRGDRREEVRFALRLADVAGVIDEQLVAAVPISQRAPVLGIELQEVFDGRGAAVESQGDADGIIEPNETVVLRYGLSNRGAIDAEEVQLTFEVPGEDHVELRTPGTPSLTVAADGASTEVVDVRLVVKGAFRGDTIPLRIHVQQADFEPLTLTDELAVDQSTLVVARAAPVESSGIGYQAGPVHERFVGDRPVGGRVEIKLPSIDEPLRLGQAAPGDSAVIVGIDEYFRIPEVEYAREDATAFRDFLVHTRGVPSNRIELLVGDDVTDEQILSAVAEAGERTVAGGIVWFYFAGHGGASMHDNERLLLGPEARGNPETMESRSVRLQDVVERAGSGGAEVVAFLDVCFSGRDRTGAELVEGGRAFVPVYTKRDMPGVLEWSASDHDEVAWKYDEVGHGAFTYFAIGALRGWADGAIDGVRDGQVTAEEAQRYVEDALARLPLESVQHPVMNVAESQSWVLSAGARLEPDPLTQSTD